VGKSLNSGKTNTENADKLSLTVMVIVLNTWASKKEFTERQKYFTTKIVCILTEQYPQHQFYIIGSESLNELFPEIVKLCILKKHKWLNKFQTEFQICKFLKKVNAGVLVSFNGYCLPRIKIPQCLIIDETDLFSPQNISQCFKKIKYLITPTENLKEAIIRKYKILSDKVRVIYQAPDESFHPVAVEKKQEIKQKYTEGKEYFIYAGNIHPQKSIITLLKAFSLFKKRQKTSMKLMLMGTLCREKDEFEKLLQTYKYRDDIVLVTDWETNNQAAILGAAYAFIYPSVYQTSGTILPEAMQCKVPVLVDESSAREVAEDAGLYFNEMETAGIADKMMLIYKDEKLREQLVEKGEVIVQKYSWQRTAGLLWQCIADAAK
jgi:glycosyltransferase involved in cell wall biosynthesis